MSEPSVSEIVAEITRKFPKLRVSEGDDGKSVLVYLGCFDLGIYLVKPDHGQYYDLVHDWNTRYSVDFIDSTIGKTVTQMMDRLKRIDD